MWTVGVQPASSGSRRTDGELPPGTAAKATGSWWRGLDTQSIIAVGAED